MVYAKEVFNRMRLHLNDLDASYFTNEILLEPLKTAVDDLRGELYNYDIPVTNDESAALIVTTAITDIGGPTGPPLPVGLIEIKELYERTEGSSENFLPVKRLEFLPKTEVLTNSLSYWSWQDQIIKFIGATSDREVEMDMIRDSVGVILNENSVIKVIHSLPFLAYRAAAVAAQDLGGDTERADKLNSNAARELDKLLNLSVKNKQAMPVTRRPYRAGYRQSGGGISTT